MMIGGSRNSWHKKRRSSSFVVVPAHFLCSSSIASSSSKGSFDDGLFLLATSAFASSSDDLVLNILINIIISLPRITNNPIVRLECFFWCWCLVQQFGAWEASERTKVLFSLLFVLKCQTHKDRASRFFTQQHQRATSRNAVLLQIEAAAARISLPFFLLCSPLFRPSLFRCKVGDFLWSRSFLYSKATTMLSLASKFYHVNDGPFVFGLTRWRTLAPEDTARASFFLPHFSSLRSKLSILLHTWIESEKPT